ncbi:TIGR02391 family protein [Geitlerinema splendidum]|nr:TIGR02391 family protein [Geitlerinema splendidum]
MALPSPIKSALPEPHTDLHPFETRNIHPDLPPRVRQMFDDGHYAEATFLACKFLDNYVGKHAPHTRSGKDRMMKVFSEISPVIQLNPLGNESERNEQEGYKYLFAGTMIGIRNPRGHSHSIQDDPGLCLDHLGLVSALLRRLNDAGF